MTVKQIQNLLQYLGYYNGIPDGDFGPLSRQAVTDFQRAFGLKVDGDPGPETQKALTHAVAYGMPERKEPDTPAEDINVPGKTGTFWDEIEFFDREEFKCKCGGQYCDGYPAEMQEKVVRIADAARKHFGRPAHVVSGLRCETWNTIQGGVWNSQHRYGEAVDLRIDGVTADDLLAFVDTQPIRYAYAINGTNVHFDITKGKR